MTRRKKTRKNSSQKMKVNKPVTTKSKPYNYFVLFLVLVCIVIFLWLYFTLPNVLETPYLLVFPPVLSAFVITIWYRQNEKIFEYIFSISACLSALSLCMDAIPNFNNKLFVTLFQNRWGYILIYILASISLAKVLVPIKEKLSL